MSVQDIDIIELESDIITFITKSTYETTVHFKYVIDSKESRLDVITYRYKGRIPFILFTTQVETSVNQVLNNTKKILLENTLKYLKDITEPNETITYEVYWHTNTSTTITKSIFSDYTIVKIIDKIFYQNPNIIVDEMKRVFEPLW